MFPAPADLPALTPQEALIGIIEYLFIFAGICVLFWQLASSCRKNKKTPPEFSRKTTKTWVLPATLIIAGAALYSQKLWAILALSPLIFLLLKYFAPEFRLNEPGIRNKADYAWHPAACIFGGLAAAVSGMLLTPPVHRAAELLTGEKIILERQDSIKNILAQSDNPTFLLSAFVSVVILAPLIEEFVFRGILFRFLRLFSGRIIAAGACGLIFGLIHKNFSGFIPLSVLGAYLCCVYERNGDIRAPMLVHASFNLNTLLVLLLAPELSGKS